jgi:hypothetical protein
MDPKDVERRFANAGWDIDDGFSGHLVIGYSSDTLSIIAARKEVFESAAAKPLFEIIDHIRNVTYWVSEIPSPQQAQELLHEHGRQPQEWDQP